MKTQDNSDIGVELDIFLKVLISAFVIGESSAMFPLFMQSISVVVVITPMMWFSSLTTGN